MLLPAAEVMTICWDNQNYFSRRRLVGKRDASGEDDACFDDERQIWKSAWRGLCKPDQLVEVMVIALLGVTTSLLR